MWNPPITPSERTIARTTRVALTETIRPSGTLVARITLSLASVGSWWIRSRAEPTATNGASAWTSGVRYIVNR